MNKSDVGDYAIGAGAYYSMSWILTFYPAFTLAVQVCSVIYVNGYDTNSIWTHRFGQAALASFVVLALSWFYTIYLFINKRYKKLIFLYLITLTPFISILRWVWRDDYYSPIPFTSFRLDWIPFL